MTEVLLSFQLGYGLVWFGLVWFGSVRFGLYRFGSVRFGSVRFGSFFSAGQNHHWRTTRLMCYN